MRGFLTRVQAPSDLGLVPIHWVEQMSVEDKYDLAYSAVIRRRWHEIPEPQRSAPDVTDRQGQLAADAPDECALYDSLTYQRGHADVFREMCKSAPHTPPTKGQRLLVVDIGAGAATVAVGLCEALGRKKRQRIDYLAFDPNPMMRKLGKRLLRQLDPGFRSADYVRSLEEMDLTVAKRVLFAFSYVSHQDSVKSSDIERWTTLIKNAVSQSSRAVELMYTTATLSGGALPQLGQQLDRVGVSRSITQVPVHVEARYPWEGADQSLVEWDNKGWSWKVQAEHWILRA